MRYGVSIAVMLAALTGCSSTNSDGVSDPFEPVNRVMWDFNYHIVDPYLYRPTALFYAEYVPSPIRTGTANFLANLDEPISFVSTLLMGEGEIALDHFNRFWINSTFGIAGIFDVASAAGIVAEERQLGDTLGHYGVGHGPYLMIPFYGPTTFREGTGDIGGFFVPTLFDLNFYQGAAKWGLQGLDDRAAAVGQEPLIEASPDSYIFVRDAYLQNRDFRASGGEINLEQDEQDDEDLNEFIDEFE
ncbi:Intermembrane phospholipid transport system lipoprotein MlaA [Vibrio stylophorae]|uniref:Intermembrane phospholipid transport system lipoprotein MlaA n=1 Tax=Vibrio stylophorae TaxID=659351 RepID=A0ABN8DW34_9VIBR|nr:MlaA family lipoprotein [Vibrio stylophorae]CAH0534073.1 Intermembrane phospholipid transport system lipoprotein MlaA [Vibrio stylophorae]